MPSVTGVRFRHVGPVYYFDPTDVDVCVNDWVVVDTSRGLSLGQVTTAVIEIEESDIQEMLAIIERIRPHNAELVEALMQLANAFDYDGILQLLQEMRSRNKEE